MRDLKSELFEGRISNSLASVWKPCHWKSRLFCPNFKWFLTKWQPFVWISNGWASRFQIPFKIPTICNQTAFRPIKIQASSDFRSPLYYRNVNYLFYFLRRKKSTTWKTTWLMKKSKFQHFSNFLPLWHQSMGNCCKKHVIKLLLKICNKVQGLLVYLNCWVFVRRLGQHCGSSTCMHTVVNVKVIVAYSNGGTHYL